MSQKYNGNVTPTGMKKILITGGSGFIGTNLVAYYLDKGDQVLNIDIKSPQHPGHHNYWKEVDILNYEHFLRAVEEFRPDYIIHLAARANLTGKTLDDYSVNIEGVKNLIQIGNKSDSIKKIIFASTILVCERGYVPEDEDDYCPPNLYGESKVAGEQLVKNESKYFEWVIVRPTSIWGPWFGPTYRRFFEMIMRGRYFNFTGKMSTKTYGFIGNSVIQLDAILKSDQSNEKTYHLGDYEPTNIKEWSKEIAEELDRKIFTAPRIFIWILAKAGDLLQKINIRFPLNSFRFNNMTTDSIKPMNEIKDLVPELQYSRKEGNRLTIEWIKSQENHE